MTLSLTPFSMRTVGDLRGCLSLGDRTPLWRSEARTVRLAPSRRQTLVPGGVRAFQLPECETGVGRHHLWFGVVGSVLECPEPHDEPQSAFPGQVRGEG